MVEFAGFEMPLYYTSIAEEHMVVRTHVGLFDISHMGELLIYGRGATAFLNYMLPSNLSRLTPGKALYTCMLNTHGGVLDDLVVYYLDEERYLLVVNASNIEKDYKWLAQQAPSLVSVENISDRVALIALQGPKATQVLQPLTDLDLTCLRFYSWRKGTVAEVSQVLISATGYTGSGGFELFLDAGNALYIWERLISEVEANGGKPAGLGARDTLRLEMGYCLYGNELDEEHTPFEAGLEWLVDFSKDFVGREALERQRAVGVQRWLVGLQLEGRHIARKGYRVLKNGAPVGVVTSGTWSVFLECSIALAYVKVEYAGVGTHLEVEGRGRLIPAVVVELPFWQDSPLNRRKKAPGSGS